MGNVTQYYDLCCKHKGKVVTIHDRSGKVYTGRIMHVDHQNVWLEPVRSGAGGFGFGWGWGWGGLWFPVALAAIGGFALGAAFFWW
ncbi:hypothetical protein MM300_02375 [Evansella sp. LMS18]|uniref:hypothetical protein n=1 Tax=Evansella sp. LMS18 TaxID=2924033 RepID=UPI0020D053E4|nr:hypothetical protein [Evansella sp. LMS18]UTR11199.1 hypothetical protein MM300_02375 [Evansella sp. LMS18]